MKKVSASINNQQISSLNPLWIIPSRSLSSGNFSNKHPIFNKGHDYFTFLKYYAAKLPGQNSRTKPINGLFTQDGRETIHTFAVPTQILVPYPSISPNSATINAIKNSHIFNKSSHINTAPSPTYCKDDLKYPNADPSHPL